MRKQSASIFTFVTLLLALVATASDDVAEMRHDLMENDVRGAAKPLGAMLNGDRDYDQAVVLESLETFAIAADTFGDMFPEGSEGGRAAAAIWEDRAGFEAAMQKWRDATAAAIAANPATLEDAKPVVGPVFGACKNCHDTYRIEED
ncbi:MAG: cytochrome c [Pseudomonadota bacterium]